MVARTKKMKEGKDKSPYNRRAEGDTDRAFKAVDRSVKPVAKDTNKTRRANTRARKVDPTVPAEPPVSKLRKVMRKPIRTRGTGC